MISVAIRPVNIGTQLPQDCLDNQTHDVAAHAGKIRCEGSSKRAQCDEHLTFVYQVRCLLISQNDTTTATVANNPEIIQPTLVVSTSAELIGGVETLAHTWCATLTTGKVRPISDQQVMGSTLGQTLEGDYSILDERGRLERGCLGTASAVGHQGRGCRRMNSTRVPILSLGRPASPSFYNLFKVVPCSIWLGCSRVQWSPDICA